MKQFIRDYLTFNKRERNGVFVLLAIITLLIIYLTIGYKFITPVKVDFTTFKKEIEILEATTELNDSANSIAPTRFGQSGQTHESIPITYFKFNPNQLAEEDWKKLGLTNKQITCIKNYEAKGGKFLNKEDFKKMYLISEKTYATLEPYIFIPTEKNLASHLNTTEIDRIDINSADSAQLITIKGIGPFYAKAIINYRNKLGGFISKHQLLELWKFDNDKLQTVEKYITIDTLKIKKVNINTCSAIDLKHPYLKWNASNAIINYRLKHGKYSAVNEIKKTDLVDDETYQKVAPYLTIE